MTDTINIVHLTSVHSRYDTRIFLKMCSSLSKKHYSVTLIVADGKGNENNNGIKIIDVGKTARGRLFRMVKTTRKVYDAARIINADIYHIHDPELMPIGLKLKKLGEVVIFDSHEDIPQQILGKPYLNNVLLRLISSIFGLYESYVCKRVDAVIAATPFIRDKFLTINPNTIDINNFPIPSELYSMEDWSKKKRQVCYVGGISVMRGINEIVSAMNHANDGIRLQLGGEFNESDIKRQIKRKTGWKSVDELGFLDRDDVRNVLEESVAGLVTLHPSINYLDSLPVKMFEYMSAGIPVIASNFPLWEEIIEINDCGFCVDPMDPISIADAINFLIEHPDRAKEMGENGYTAVQNKYNWHIEEQKLLKLYQKIIMNKQRNHSSATI